MSFKWFMIVNILCLCCVITNANPQFALSDVANGVGKTLSFITNPSGKWKSVAKYITDQPMALVKNIALINFGIIRAIVVAFFNIVELVAKHVKDMFKGAAFFGYISNVANMVIKASSAYETPVIQIIDKFIKATEEFHS